MNFNNHEFQYYRILYHSGLSDLSVNCNISARRAKGFRCPSWPIYDCLAIQMLWYWPSFGISARRTTSYTLSREYWVVKNRNFYSYYLQVYIVLTPICACKNNRRIWRHNARLINKRKLLLPRKTIFGKDYRPVASLVSQKSLFTLTHALFYIHSQLLNIVINDVLLALVRWRFTNLDDVVPVLSTEY